MILTPRCYTRDWLIDQAVRTGTQDVVLEIDLKPQNDDGNRAIFKMGVDALNTHLIRSRLSLYETKNGRRPRGPSRQYHQIGQYREILA